MLIILGVVDNNEGRAFGAVAAAADLGSGAERLDHHTVRQANAILAPRTSLTNGVRVVLGQKRITFQFTLDCFQEKPSLTLSIADQLYVRLALVDGSPQWVNKTDPCGFRRAPRSHQRQSTAASSMQVLQLLGQPFVERGVGQLEIGPQIVPGPAVDLPN